MWNTTAVTRKLGISLPIIQGPFGGGLSSPKLLSAVSNGGGLGSFGAHHLSPAEIRQLGPRLRELTDKPFALNLWISDHDKNGLNISEEEFDIALSKLRPYFKELGVPEPAFPKRFGQVFEEQIEAILDVKPAVFSFVFGIPPASVLDACRSKGITTVGTAITLDEAIALDQTGVDVIVASGFEAGGHRASFLRPAEDSLIGTFALIPQVVDAVKTPVIAAGGIADGRGVAAALTLGAQAVQIGTAFLACEESNASQLHRDSLFRIDARYTALTRSFSGRLARGIRNRFVDETRSFEQSWPPYPAQSWITSHLKSAGLEQGRADLISLWCGQAAPLLKHRTAQTLIDSLVKQTSAILG